MCASTWGIEVGRVQINIFKILFMSPLVTRTLLKHNSSANNLLIPRTARHILVMNGGGLEVQLLAGTKAPLSQVGQQVATYKAWLETCSRPK